MSNNFTHPLPLGFKIISIEGECDEGDDGPRETGPNAVGEIISRAKFDSREGYSYRIVFQPSGVWVHIDQGDSIDDPTKYRPAAPELTTRLKIRAIARAFQERAKELQYKGKKRDDAALDFFCGAANLAEINGDEPLLNHLQKVLILSIAVRGMFGVNEIAAWPDEEPEKKAA